jgi:methylenetetrahydrofolate dehydrogenase (NADP+) / methenyltetrahydrofolate cyclohydrolase
MILIDGKAVAERLNEQTREKIARLKERGITPGLAVVLIGENPASMAYVRNKDRTSQKLGFFSRKIELPAETSQSEVLKIVQELNVDPAIHGILVQSPPPPQIDEKTIVVAIDPAKDVDGFHPMNVGRLAMGDPAGKRYRNNRCTCSDHRPQHVGGQTPRPPVNAKRQRG